MDEVKEILMKQLKKLEETDSDAEKTSYAMCEITNTLIAIERAEIALGKREFGGRIKKGK